MRFLISRIIVAIQALLFLSRPFSLFAGDGEFEVQVAPLETDNFYESQARLWLPLFQGKIAAALVFLNGTDSDARSMVSSAEWQTFASKHHVALIGCHFRGDGEPYEEADKGSGDALLKMIRELSNKISRPDLDTAPLVIIGHSAGAMFAYNFTCWRPDLVLAFISIKSGPISPTRNIRAAQVPGLFILGERDLQGRVRSIANAYLEMNVENRLWALAVEPGGGHGSSEQIRDMVHVYLEDILSLLSARFLPEENSDVYMRGVSRTLGKPDQEYQSNLQPISDATWLPGEASARLWENFVKPVSLPEFVKKGGIPENLYQNDFAHVLDFGDIDLRDKDRPLRRSFNLNYEVSPNQKVVSEDEKIHLLLMERRGPRDIVLTLEIDPDQLTPGTLHSSFRITQDSGETLAFTVLAHVIASYRATPSSLYVGVIPNGRIAEMHVLIKDDSTDGVRVVSVRSSKPEFAEAKIIEGGNLLCRFDGGQAFGNQSGHFDVTLAGKPEKRLKIPFIVWVSKKHRL